MTRQGRSGRFAACTDLYDSTCGRLASIDYGESAPLRRAGTGPESFLDYSGRGYRIRCVTFDGEPVRPAVDLVGFCDNGADRSVRSADPFGGLPGAAPDHPALTWLVELDTDAHQCRGQLGHRLDIELATMADRPY